MGVKGLLPSLRSITRPVQLSKYSGLSVAVDAMSWLHRGVHAGDVRTLAKAQWQFRLQQEEEEEEGNKENYCRSSSREQNCGNGYNGDDNGPSRKIDFDRLVTNNTTTTTAASRSARSNIDSRDRGGSRGGRGGRSKDKGSNSNTTAVITAAQATEAAAKCVSYAMRQAETLTKQYGMTVTLVIDGGSLPTKQQIDKGRRDERRKAYQDALAAEARSDSRNARKLYARACSVTHEMRHELIERCRRSGVDFIVAPYEADAQMAQLAHCGMVDLIVTEDSDLLAYGCPRVLFKVDVAEGRGQEIQLMRDLASNSDLSFRNWTHDMFVYMCILNGCDYCDGVPGIGIKTAHKLVRMYRTPAKIFKALRAAGRMPLAGCGNSGNDDKNDFEETFWRAYRTFRHQTVYNRVAERAEPLLPIGETAHGGGGGVIVTTSGPDWSYVGPMMDDETAKAIATGMLHPTKKVPWDAVLAAGAAFNGDGGGIAVSRPHSSRESHHHDRPANRSPKDLFKFFARKPSREDDANKTSLLSSSSPSRPPLQEIYLNDGDKQGSRNGGSNDKTTTAAATIRGGGQPIPVHFNEYSSTLVGTTFEPLSRRNKGPGGGAASRNISRAVQRLKANAKAKVVRDRGRVKRGEEKGTGGADGRNDGLGPSRNSVRSAPDGVIRNRSRSADAACYEHHRIEPNGSGSLDRDRSCCRPEQRLNQAHDVQAGTSPGLEGGHESYRELLDCEPHGVQPASSYQDPEPIYHQRQDEPLPYGDSEAAGYDATINQGIDLGLEGAYDKEDGTGAFDNSVYPYGQPTSSRLQLPDESLDVSISSPELKRQNLNASPESFIRDSGVGVERYHSSATQDHCYTADQQLRLDWQYKNHDPFVATESGAAYGADEWSSEVHVNGNYGENAGSLFSEGGARPYLNGGGDGGGFSNDSHHCRQGQSCAYGDDTNLGTCTANDIGKGDALLDISPKDVTDLDVTVLVDRQDDGGCMYAGMPSDYDRPLTTCGEGTDRGGLEGSSDFGTDGRYPAYKQGDEYEYGPRPSSWDNNATAAVPPSYQNAYYGEEPIIGFNNGAFDLESGGAARSTQVYPELHRAASYEY